MAHVEQLRGLKSATTELEERPQKPRLTFVGGGSGTSNTLEMLRPSLPKVEVDVICTTFDDGGSSGILKKVFAGTEAEVAGFGDFRKMVYALAPDEIRETYLKYWERRSIANGNKEWDGHPLGNFYLSIATQAEGSFTKALDQISKLYRLQGRIHPVTIDSSKLYAKTLSGKHLEHEHVIDQFWDREDPIIEIGLTRPVRLHSSAKEAIEKADILVLGPGSHYTSLLPNLLVNGFRESVLKAKRNGATLVYVSNLVAEMGYGEPYGYTVCKYLEDIQRYLPQAPIDVLVIHTAGFPQDRMAPYLKENKHPIVFDREACNCLVGTIVEGDFLSITKEGRFRHSPELAKALLNLSGIL